MRIAIIAMGDMGSGVAARLVHNGVRVVTNLVGRSDASADRAARAGVEIAPDDAAMIVGCDMILSIVPPAHAKAMAERLREPLSAAAAPPLFVDCNAIAPATMREIASTYEASGLPMVDAGILGGPPHGESYSPRIYASGPGAADLAALKAFGLDVIVCSDRIGDASAVKMSFAGMTKGSHAVALSMMMGAERAGVGEILWKEIEAAVPGLLARPVRMTPEILKKAYRWDGEMEEIARFLAAEPGSETIFHGAAKLYEALSTSDGATGDQRALLDAFTARAR